MVGSNCEDSLHYLCNKVLTVQSLSRGEGLMSLPPSYEGVTGSSLLPLRPTHDLIRPTPPSTRTSSQRNSDVRNTAWEALGPFIHALHQASAMGDDVSAWAGCSTDSTVRNAE